MVCCRWTVFIHKLMRNGRSTKVMKRTSTVTVGTHDSFYLLRLGQLFRWIESERWQEGDRPRQGSKY